MRRTFAATSALFMSVIVPGTAAVVVADQPDQPAVGSIELSVMSFNIFYGGDELDLQTGDFCAVTDGCDETFPYVVEAVLASGADVVGLQEAERNTRRLAEALGWHSSERNHLISRYPVIDPPGADGAYAFVEVSPGRVVAVANLHLTSDPYGPYAARDGASADEVLELERSVRLPELQPVLDALPELEAQGIPLFVTGDFNSPSHLDWTAAADRQRTDVPYPLVWPTAAALADAGLRDSYREAHPDPVAKPGFTWSPGGPESAPEGEEVFDRIDWVLVAGEATTTASRIVGEADGPDVDIAMSPYPSDHRAVVSTFGVEPGSADAYAAVARRRVFVGDRLAVDVHAPDQVGARVGLQRIDENDDDDDDDEFAAVKSLPAGATDGRIRFDTRRLDPGDYEAVLVSASGEIVSRSPFWVYRRGARTSITTSARAYDVGEPISVSWEAARGQRRDWVAVYRCERGRCEPNSEYLVWVYTDAAVEGRAEIGAEASEGIASWPLPPGTYVVRLLADDSFRASATSRRFTIG